MAVVYILVWQRREKVRASLPDQVLTVLALILALMTFGKVLSPQYFVWTLPALSLVAARDKWIALLGFLVLALTQAEFPALYWRLLDMKPDALAVVITRNTLLLVLFAFTVYRLYRLPETVAVAGPTLRPGQRTPAPKEQISPGGP